VVASRNQRRRNRRTKRIYNKLQLNAECTVILFPIAGLFHDYELFRVYSRSEHPVMFAVKLMIYLYFTTIVIVAWLMKTEYYYNVGNASLIVCPLYCMIYTNYIFSHKFGPGGRR